MRYGISKFFRFDFISLYCLICKIAQDMNVDNTISSQLKSLTPDYEPRKFINSQAMVDMPIEVGAYYLMDKGYVDFDRLFHLFQQQKACLVSRTKDNMKYTVFEAREVNKQTDVICNYLLFIIALKMYHRGQNLNLFSNVFGQVLFEWTPQDEFFD